MVRANSQRIIYFLGEIHSQISAYVQILSTSVKIDEPTKQTSKRFILSLVVPLRAEPWEVRIFPRAWMICYQKYLEITLLQIALNYRALSLWKRNRIFIRFLIPPKRHGQMKVVGQTGWTERVAPVFDDYFSNHVAKLACGWWDWCSRSVSVQLDDAWTLNSS